MKTAICPENIRPSVGPLGRRLRRLVKRLRRHRARDDLLVGAGARDGDAAAAAAAVAAASAAAAGRAYVVNSRLSARPAVFSDLRHSRQRRPHLERVALATVA